MAIKITESFFRLWTIGTFRSYFAYIDFFTRKQVKSMADKKKKKREKGQTKAKVKKELNPLAYEIIGVVLIAFAVITFFELGMVGKVVYNISLFLLGNLHFFVPFLCILIAGMLMVRRRGVKLSNRIIVGLMLIVASFTVFSHSMLFEQLHRANLLLNDSVLRETWRILIPSEGVVNRNNSLGGGMIGALLFSMMHVLFGATGAKIAAVVLLIIGTILITGKALVPILIEKSPSIKINFSMLTKEIILNTKKILVGINYQIKEVK